MEKKIEQFASFQLKPSDLKHILGGYVPNDEGHCQIPCTGTNPAQTRQCLEDKTVTSCQSDVSGGMVHCWYSDGTADFYECPIV